jgi:hypothetical protein
MGIEGTWRGEYTYDRQYENSLNPAVVPFILKIRQAGISGLKGGFTGICQDDPTVTNVTIHATIHGTIELKDIFFAKLYPKTFARDAHGNIILSDEPHPDIFYSGVLADNHIFHGQWRREKTLRMFEGRLGIMPPDSGHWWMKKM